ncbi:uncharacterized protein LOC120658629 [Panicum virgatum]|uniref:uncharacterized protein LOC120658629 n=1 Tax=Panicum virgatum TaxID=38727 RepID=UPI0019D65E35|nr:uncharacterized protein LOC120658629 [Panicum virgatum]
MHLEKDTIIGNVMMSQLVGLADDWSSISLKITEAYELSVCRCLKFGKYLLWKPQENTALIVKALASCACCCSSPTSASSLSTTSVLTIGVEFGADDHHRAPDLGHGYHPIVMSHDRPNKDDDELESMKKDNDTKAHLDNACLCTYSLAGSQVYDLVLLVPS